MLGRGVDEVEKKSSQAKKSLIFQLLSHVQFFVTTWTIAHQAPLFLGLPRQEYWSGLPFLPPGDHPNLGIQLTPPILGGRFFTAEPPGKSQEESWHGKSILVNLWHVSGNEVWRSICYSDSTVILYKKNQLIFTSSHSIASLFIIWQSWHRGFMYNRTYICI